MDGRRVVASEGEPVAVALAAAGRLVLGRSVKYHRARGAACYSGRCDGCLMRVDGVQSVMTCQVAAKDGMRVETQNVVGSADNDLLAATDWFFPKGMNHHEMFTWSEALNNVMKKVARRIAGIGELPDAIRPVPPTEPIETDVLVVGGGPAGLIAAKREAETGRSVALVEESAQLGGALRWWPGPLDDGSDPRALADRLEAEAREAGVSLLAGVSALGAYDAWEDLGGAEGPAPIARRPGERAIVLLDSPDGARIARATRVVIATGRHEGAGAFGGSDRPGVIGARAACVLLAHGVLPGEKVGLFGEHPALAQLAHALRAAGARVHGPLPEGALTFVDGRPEVTKATFDSDGLLRTEDCDCVVVAPPTSASYELASQLGVDVRWAEDRYELGDGPTDVDVVGWAREFRLTPRRRLMAKIVICRCEDVTRKDFIEATEKGYLDLESVKRYTGFGTGWCQGKQCVGLATRELVRLGGKPPAGPITPRQPYHPVPIAHLASLLTKGDET